MEIIKASTKKGQCIVVGMIPKGTRGYGDYEMVRRVYSPDGIAPTIRTMRGGNLEPKVAVRG